MLVACPLQWKAEILVLELKPPGSTYEGTYVETARSVPSVPFCMDTLRSPGCQDGLYRHVTP